MSLLSKLLKLTSFENQNEVIQIVQSLRETTDFTTMGHYTPRHFKVCPKELEQTLKIQLVDLMIKNGSAQFVESEHHPNDPSTREVRLTCNASTNIKGKYGL